MKWVAMSGSWRHMSPEIEHDVRNAVRAVLVNGDGIVTGGALNVDSIATDEALRIDSKAIHLKVYLPVTLERYAEYYYSLAREEEVVSYGLVDDLVAQLTHLRVNTQALIENTENTLLDQTTFFACNTDIIEASDELIAFQVNASKGTQDAIDKAVLRGKPVTLHSYTIAE